jgi:hypothetical protein
VSNDHNDWVFIVVCRIEQADLLTRRERCDLHGTQPSAAYRSDIEKAGYRQFADARKVVYAARHRELGLRRAMHRQANIGGMAQPRIAHGLEHGQRGGEVASSHAGRPRPGPGPNPLGALAN